jgi:hypothetical protein
MAPASILSEVVLESSLGDRVDAYRRYARRRYGRLADASNKGAVLYSSLVGSLVVALAVNWYAFFTPDGIVLNAFFRLHEEKFAYTEVTRIRSASTHTRRPSGKLRYLVDFENGRAWNSNSLLVDDYEKIDAIARYVSDRSGMSIEPVQDF